MTTAVAEAPTRTIPNVYVARQPIFDRALNVVGYELLFRNGPENYARVDDPESATAQLLLNVFAGIGLESLVGQSKAFVNFPRGFLVGDYPLPDEAKRITLEVLEDVPIDEELLGGLERLAGDGYTIALDDVVFESRLRALLLGVANIVKLDLRRLPRDQWERHVAEFRKYRVQLLAEKVETEEELETCLALGFDLFQGYFFARPSIVSGARPTSPQVSLLQLLAKLTNPAATAGDLERVFRADAALSYSLLRFVNSSHAGLRHQIDSLRQAILLVGFNGIRTLAMLAAVSQSVGRPAEALRTPIRRALFCERIARRLGGLDPSAAFTVGLVSGLEMILCLHLETILEMLPLSDQLRAALTRHEGLLGEVLLCALAHEEETKTRNMQISLPPHLITEDFIASIAATEQMFAV